MADPSTKNLDQRAFGLITEDQIIDQMPGIIKHLAHELYFLTLIDWFYGDGSHPEPDGLPQRVRSNTLTDADLKKLDDISFLMSVGIIVD